MLIDITPQSLIERLLAGKVYPGERAQVALNNFFEIENLSALRGVSLRQVAEKIEAKRIAPEAGSPPHHERLIDTAAPQAIGERLLALIKPQPKSQRVVRRAWRSAQRLGAELDLLCVADHHASDEEQQPLDALRRLAIAIMLSRFRGVHPGPGRPLSMGRLSHKPGALYESTNARLGAFDRRRVRPRDGH